jgi:hypothetical protein
MTELFQTAKSGRDTQGKTPVYRPALNGVDFDITVNRLDLSMGEFNHDIAIFNATSDTLTTSDNIRGKAISFYYGLAPNTELFTGYVENVENDQGQGGSGRLSMMITCLGATKELQQGRPRAWVNSSIPRVGELMAYRGALGFHGHHHNIVWPLLAQTDETDWKYLCNIVKRLGWSVFNRYGVVMVYDPVKLFRESGSFTELVSKEYSSTAYDDYERALIDFVPSEASDASYRQIGAKLAFFNGETVQSIEQTGTGWTDPHYRPVEYTNFRHLSGVIARTPAEAAVYVNATSFATTSWTQQATARVLGNASLYPGMSVDIRTMNPKYTKDHFNGRWLIRNVQHNADRQTFQTLLALVRPSQTMGAAQTPYKAFWELPGDLAPVSPSSDTQVSTSTTRSRPVLTLKDGRWQSSWTDWRAATELT